MAEIVLYLHRCWYKFINMKDIVENDKMKK